MGLVSALVGYGAQAWYKWLAPLPTNINAIAIWKPTTESVAFSVLLGLGVVGTLAWYEQFKNNKELTESFPRIVLADPPIEVVPFNVNATIAATNPHFYRGATFHIGTYTAIRLRVGNRPFVNTDKASTRVNARIRFYSETGERLAIIDGRWADSPQLAHRDATQDYVEALAVPFPAGAERSLDLAFKRPGEQICTALNNDNFIAAPNLDMPGRVLNGTVTVNVELNGPYVMTEIIFKISCAEPMLMGDVVISNKMPS